MKGMILKDWYLNWKFYWIYFAISLVFTFLSFWTDNNYYMLSYPLILIGMIPMGLQNMDEAYKWDVYCGSLPCSKKLIVSEKYLMGLMLTLPLAVFMLLVKTLDMLLHGNFQWSVLAELALIACMFGLLMSAISMPLIFKFGSEKGRVIQAATIGLSTMGATMLNLLSDGEVPTFSENAGALLVMMLPLGLYIGSWWLSVKIYEKREIR